ncbi:dihydrodipicolinate synthase [Dactylonectria estremocensis]|uniref:Dihydrodipicolinate synthase n=1 Tax=Dactylonectria estremocensis TaxID=1079267 RepID=A0A9P9IZM5_9HYPO|nr:dihydrodipicolinate synthase [Dactylonectria estremocensis]
MAPSPPPDSVLLPSLQPAIDVPTQVAHSVHLAKSGITGLVLMGSTGEAIHLSPQERFDMISGVRKGLDEAGYRDYPIMAGVLINSVDEALEWLQDAHNAGAQWGLVLAPGYFGGAANQDNLIEWYTLVADKSPLPILIYNYPGVTNNLVVGVKTYVKLTAHPNIVGCKMSHGDVSYHVQVSLHPSINHSKFRVYSGFGQQLGPIVRPLDESTLEEVRRLQWKVSAAEEFIVNHGILGIRESIGKELGFGHLSGGRLPLRSALAAGVFENWRSVILGQMAEEEKRF